MICRRMLPRKCESSLQASQSNWVEAYQEAPPTCSIVVTCGTCTTLRKQQHHSTRRPILPILETPVKLAPPPHPQVIDQSDFCVALLSRREQIPFQSLVRGQPRHAAAISRYPELVPRRGMITFKSKGSTPLSWSVYEDTACSQMIHKEHRKFMLDLPFHLGI